ncbi:hypothetical protein VNI00_004366 [Paramarasmius palmivorus]|uniref:Uncharacterized protein n=1 Tax=Paramarasmius palmivorus TaxID=297713 RepID=A0AAW0DPR3_9AGAR
MEAITFLRGLNVPPSPFDALQPSGHAQTAGDAIAALVALSPAAYAPRARRALENIKLVKANWDTAQIGLWVQFFLDLALKEPVPSYDTVEELGLVQKVLFTIPVFLQYPTCSLDQEKEIGDLVGMAPYIPRLGARIWVKLIRVLHTTWVSWSSLLAGILFVTNNPNPSGEFVRELVTIQTSEGINIAPLIIRFMQHITPIIRSNCITHRLFIGFHTTMALFVCCCIPRSVLPASHVSFVVLGGVGQLVTLLKTLVSRRGVIRFAREGSGQFGDLTGAIMTTERSLQEAMDGVQAVSDALEAGLILVIFKSQRYYDLECAKPDQYTINPPSKIWDFYANLLQRIAVYLVYPAVLRRFWRSITIITNEYSDLEQNIRLSAEQRLWSCWEQCQRRAKSFRAMYELMKMPGMGGSLCSNEKGHPYESNIDRTFFASITKLYCANHPGDILRLLLSFKAKQQKASDGSVEQGVVVLSFYDLNCLDFDSIDCANVLPLSGLYCDRRLARDQTENLRKKGAQVEETEMLIVAFFPATTKVGESVLTVIEILDLPGAVDEDEDDDYVEDDGVDDPDWDLEQIGLALSPRLSHGQSDNVR